ncbi:sensor histidine kinase [Spirosoma fluviale]|uniref:Histidine kinase n=1 Tax=Spirosoma fluviale TaxID=1597977 RepID=A0A286FHI7_9BACT|nr:histidine kinase [Spirosoma fluviale]SOD82668.1 Histidine kinase [Spirosoma fluviale]
MRDLQRFQRYELIFVLTTILIYVSRRLIEEINYLNDMVESVQRNGISSASVWRNLARYDHTLNNNLPLIASACLILGAWYVFHSLAFPLINDLLDDKKGWLSIGLSFLLILVSVFIYHYLKLYVRFRMDESGSVISLHVFSLYRKRTVLADTIGFGILICTYEFWFQCYRYLSARIRQESEAYFRIVSLLLVGGITVFVFIVALFGHLPPTLFKGDWRNALLVMGIGVQVWFLQGYFYAFVLPLTKTSSAIDVLRAGRIATYMLFIMPFLKTSLTSEVVLASRIATFLVMVIITSLLLWGGCTGFHYTNRTPFLLMCVALTVSVSVAFIRQSFQKEKTELQTQVSATSAELASLRAQINPHFLFNALNSLYATALKENSEKTADGIQKLGDMMRFMLQENNHDRIPLDKEIEYLRNYIQIQRLRIDETQGIEIRVNIQEPNRAIYIAPMMLTPFVENAFKHGISLRHPSWIYITLTLDDTRLYFKVHNSRYPKASNDPEEAQSGVGLDNVRKRLELIYSGKYQLTIQQSEQDYFVSLTLVYV